MPIALPLTSPERAAQYRASGQWADVTIAERVLAAAVRYPEKEAIRCGGVRLRYADFADNIRCLAKGLTTLGLLPGGIVAGQLPNGPEIPLLHIACNLAGLLFIPLHDSWRSGELRHLLSNAGVTVLVTPHIYRDFNHYEMIAELRAELPGLRHYFTLGGAAGPGARDFGELMRLGPLDATKIASLRPDPDLPAAAMLSGGTTSISKISRFSSNNLLAMLDVEAAAAEFSAADVVAAIAPTGTGATGYIYGVLTPLLYGATSVILPRWGDPAEAIALIVREHCTYGVAIPTQLTKLVPVLETRQLVEFHDFRCFANAGAPLPYETAVKIEDLMGCVIQSIYGATDGGTPTMTTIHDQREKRLATVGRVVRGCECLLLDEKGNPVPQGEAGEIVWRGADKSWGYLGDEAQTAAAFKADHFYKSGDLGRFDGDGYLQVVGRIKDMILRGGRNVSPLAIEERLIRHPAVVDVAVVPMPDLVLGERACAFVVLKPGAVLDLAAAVEFLKGEDLAVWQLPERLEVIDEIPNSTGGKALKRALTAIITEKLKVEAAQRGVGQ
jgi:non-ribosomal peptide synthetase component E (peptide arylation enzyme)